MEHPVLSELKELITDLEKKEAETRLYDSQ